MKNIEKMSPGWVPYTYVKALALGTWESNIIMYSQILAV